MGPSSQMVVADLENDGTRELLLGFYNGMLRVYDLRTGVLRWRFQAGDETIEATLIAVDVDGDGELEVLVAGYGRALFCLRGAVRTQ